MPSSVTEGPGHRRLALATAWLSLLSCVASLPIPAQTPNPPPPPADGSIADDFVPQSWTTGNGLPHDEIRALCPARSGVLWIGTRAGLARFDGNRFATFDHLNTPALVSDECTALAEDAEGGLWIGTTRGLVYRDRDRAFRRFTEADGLPHDHITSVQITRQGVVWISTRGGVARRDPGSWQAYRQNQDGGLTVSGIGGLGEDPVGGIWAASVRGLDPFSVAENRFRTALGSGQEAWWDAGFFPHRADGNWDALIWRRAPETDLWMRWRSGAWEVIRSLDLDNAGRPCFLCPDSRGGVWTPAGAGRLARLTDTESRFYRLPLGAPDDFAIAGALDRAENLWIGTERSGLLRLRPRRFEGLGRTQGLVDDNVWALAETPDRALWIGTEHGLARRHPTSISTLRSSDGLPHDTIRALAADTQGQLWIGGLRGASVLRSQRPEPIPLPAAEDADKVRVIHVGPTGTLWIGTLRGLFRVHRDSLETRPFFSPSPGGIDVRSILETAEGTLWVGTDGAGLYRFRDLRAEAPEPVADLSDPHVWSIHQDADRILWVTTEHGLNRIEDGRTFAFFRRHGLPENQINHLVEDDTGQFWCGTERGIFRVSKTDLNRIARDGDGEVSCAVYDDTDGLPSPETNGQKSSPAGLRTRDGRIWFATARGAVGFDPRHLHEGEILPNPGIERVRVLGRTVFSELPVADDEGTIAATSADARELRLPPGSGHAVEFAFESHHPSAPTRVRFRYRLHGFETRWTETSTRREAFYTNLEPGHYRFEVLAATRHGLWNPTPATLSFEILPFLHETLAFRVTCITALIGLVAAVWWWRVRELRRIHRLEASAALSDERRRIATDLHDHVGADLTHLTLLAEIAELRDHPLSTEALQNLSARARQATEALRETIWATLPEHQNLAQLADRIGDMATQRLGAAEIRSLHRPPVDASAIVLRPETCREIYLAAKEILHNAIRHSGASLVELRWEIFEDDIVLTLADDGRGLPPSMGDPPTDVSPDPAAPDLPEELSPESKNSSWGGLGLASVRRRLVSLGGSLEIRAHQPRGTRVTLRFPAR